MMQLALFTLIAFWTQLANAQSWEFLYQTDGISVYSSSQENLQCYRAEGVIETNLFELLAVIADLGRRPEWVRNLETSKAIEGDISSSVLLYEKYNFPWPASDRDTVTRSNTKVDYQKLQVEAEFFNSIHRDFPEQDGIVRIRIIKGYQFFEFRTETTTFNRNTLCIDIGGSLPNWLVRIVSRDMPVNTLKDLQSQVRKTSGQYAKFVDEHRRLAAAGKR